MAKPLFEGAANNYITVIKLRMIRIHREQIKRTWRSRGRSHTTRRSVRNGRRRRQTEPEGEDVTSTTPAPHPTQIVTSPFARLVTSPRYIFHPVTAFGGELFVALEKNLIYFDINKFSSVCSIRTAQVAECAGAPPPATRPPATVSRRAAVINLTLMPAG